MEKKYNQKVETLPLFLKSISVVHLVGPPYELSYFISFIASYKKFEAGYRHNFVLLFNGKISRGKVEIFLDYLKSQKLSFIHYHCTITGRDIDAYFWISKILETDYLLFLNSHSQLLTSNWLLCYIDIMRDLKVGVISATASYQSYFSTIKIFTTLSWEREKSFWLNFRKYKLFLKNSLLYRFYFKKFPNPHIRTNAFLIQRSLMLSINYQKLTTRIKAYIFESGRNSFTNQILKAGYKILVIDKNGKTYEPKDWPQSKTFWINEQENLLVSDNQTRIYDNATEQERKQMNFLAWGIK